MAIQSWNPAKTAWSIDPKTGQEHYLTPIAQRWLRDLTERIGGSEATDLTTLQTQVNNTELRTLTTRQETPSRSFDAGQMLALQSAAPRQAVARLPNDSDSIIAMQVFGKR